jgi:hypothetical protein
MANGIVVATQTFVTHNAIDHYVVVVAIFVDEYCFKGIRI